MSEPTSTWERQWLNAAPCAPPSWGPWSTGDRGGHRPARKAGPATSRDRSRQQAGRQGAGGIGGFSGPMVGTA